MGNSGSAVDGEFSGNTTSEDIGRAFGSRAAGKHVIITGANVGLGFETARILATHGAIVTICCRNVKAGEEAVAKIRAESSAAQVEVGRLDLGDLKTVRAFARAYKESGKPLHILINNAGVMACPKSYTSDDFETQFGVNHLGHFLLTTELLPVLQRTGTAQEPARVVNLSSIGHRVFSPPEGIELDDLHADRSYHIWPRYGASKLANVAFSNELNRRMQSEGQHVISVAVHPGVIAETNLMRHGVSFGYYYEIITSACDWASLITFAQEKQKNTKQGAATTLFTALSPDVVPGAYYADCKVDSFFHPKTQDSELLRRLWEVSEELIKDK